MDWRPGRDPAAVALIGRDRELAALRAALGAALAGRGSLVLIGGEAGIGKTTLAEAILAEASDEGALMLVGRSYDLSETPPYGPWRELFARAPSGDGLPALPAAVLPADREGEALGSQDAIIARVSAYLAALAARRPLVLLLDDLHWADPASLDLLRVVARNATDVPCLLIATYRADEVDHDRPLATLLPLLVREARAARLDLRPLDAAAIGALVAARYALGATEAGRLVPYLAARTEGNALFLGEVLRTLEGAGTLRQEGDRWVVGDPGDTPVPALLRQVIAGRLARLDGETGRLVAVAAVIGQDVPLAVWAAAGGVAEGALLEHAERAIAARLLMETADGAGVRFPHALVREALYAATPALRRRATHRQVGAALLAGPRPDPDAVAYHLQLAGDPRAVAWLVRAGLRAHGAGANLTAAERFTAAATLLAGDEAHVRERGWLLYLSAELFLFSDRARTFRYLDDIVALGPLASDPALAAHGRLLRGMAHGNQGQLRAAIAAIEQGVAALEALPVEYRRWYGSEVAVARIGALLPEGERASSPPTGPHAPPGALRQRGSLANWYGWTGRYREARALGEATIAAALDDETLRQDVPGRWGLAHAYAALGQSAGSRHEYALARADSSGRHSPYNVHYVLWAELLHAVLPYQADDIPERTRLAAEADRAWAESQGTTIATPYPSQADLPLALIEGRWAEAHRVAQAALDGAGAHTQAAIVALGILARHQGDPAGAWARVRELHPAGSATEPGDCFFVPGIAALALAADLALDAGDLALAREWIAAYDRWLAWSGAVRDRAEGQRLWSAYHRAAGDLAAAQRHAAGALGTATTPRQPLALLAAHRALGELDTGAGRHAEATAHLVAALALADACAAPYERALSLLALAELRAAEGNREEAGVSLAGARTTLAKLGAAPALTRADALAARLTAAPAPASPALPFGLTAREAAVLRLVARGLTNAQVGDRLFVTSRTVNAHLTSIYTKLGVEGRAAAIRLALDHDLR